MVISRRVSRNPSAYSHGHEWDVRRRAVLNDCASVCRRHRLASVFYQRMVEHGRALTTLPPSISTYAQFVKLSFELQISFL